MNTAPRHTTPVMPATTPARVGSSRKARLAVAASAALAVTAPGVALMAPALATAPFHVSSHAAVTASALAPATELGDVHLRLAPDSTARIDLGDHAGKLSEGASLHVTSGTNTHVTIERSGYDLIVRGTSTGHDTITYQFMRDGRAIATGHVRITCQAEDATGDGGAHETPAPLPPYPAPSASPTRAPAPATWPPAPELLTYTQTLEIGTTARQNLHTMQTDLIDPRAGDRVSLDCPTQDVAAITRRGNSAEVVALTVGEVTCSYTWTRADATTIGTGSLLVEVTPELAVEGHGFVVDVDTQQPDQKTSVPVGVAAAPESASTSTPTAGKEATRIPVETPGPVDVSCPDAPAETPDGTTYPDPATAANEGDGHPVPELLTGQTDTKTSTVVLAPHAHVETATR